MGTRDSRRQALTFFMCLLLGTTLASGAEESKIESPPQPPPVQAVVIANKRPVPIEKISRFVTVITREDIRNQRAVFVVDVLRALPGVTVMQSGPSGRNVGLFLRGLNSNHALVLVDGTQVNSPTTGQFDVTSITVDNVDRIEVLRGPQSVLYGADAMGGVVNIVTREGREGLHSDARFEVGSHETFFESAEADGGAKGQSFSGSFSRLDTEGPSENDGFEDTTVTTSVTLAPAQGHKIENTFRYFSALAGIEDGAFAVDPNRWQKSREQVSNTRYTHTPVPWFEQSLNYNFFHDRLLSVDPPDTSTQLESRFKLDSDRHTLEYKADFYIGDFDILTTGYEFEHTRSNNKSVDKILRNHGWYVQDELELFKRWTIVGGVRIDRHSTFGTEASPLVSSSLRFPETGTKFKASFGKAFRAPSTNELFFPGFGDENLRPEKSWGWDAGVEQSSCAGRLESSAAYFQNDVDDLIQFALVGGSFKAANIARARTQGVELDSTLQLSDSLSVKTFYTYTNAVDKDLGKFLVRRPRHQGGMAVDYRWRRWHLHSDLRMVGARDDQTGVFTRPAREKIGGYVRWDASVGFQLSKFLEVYGRVENLSNDHYQEVIGFDSPSTQFFVGVRGSL